MLDSIYQHLFTLNSSIMIRDCRDWQTQTYRGLTAPHLGRRVWCFTVSSGFTGGHTHCLLFITSFLLHWWTLSVIPDFLRSFINVLSAEGLVSSLHCSHVFWLVNQRLYGWWRHFCRIYWFVCCSLQSSHLLIHPWGAALWQCVIHPDCFPAPPGIKTITVPSEIRLQQSQVIADFMPFE